MAANSPLPPPLPSTTDPFAPTPTVARDESSAPFVSSAVAPPGYEILGELGRGGMGIVYKARDIKLNRLVALKMILTDLPTSSQADRFRTEALAVARFQHPNIVRLYEAGSHEGRPYFALEYVEGGSLAQQINGTPQAPRDAAALVLTLAAAVHHAHQQGVVHRDLKPANILLSRGEERGARGEDVFLAPHPSSLVPIPKITDFGLAKKLDDAGQTHSGSVIGTPSYMSPEQADGHTDAIGPGTDVYGLGAVLYELLTGRPPFQGATLLDILEQVRTREPVPPSRLAGKLPRDLETICLKCLEKEPRRRYSSADALADDLRRFLDGRTVAARPTAAWERALRWARRRPGVAAAALLTVAILIASFVGAWLQYRAADTRRQKAEAAKLHAAGLQRSEKAQNDAAQADQDRAKEQRRAETAALLQTRHTAYSASVSAATRALTDGQPQLAEEYLEACPEEFCGWEWYHLKRRFYTAEWSVPARPVAAVKPGSFLFAAVEGARLRRFGSSTMSLSVWDLEKRYVIKQLDCGMETVNQVTISGDGRRIIAVGDDLRNGRGQITVFTMPEGNRRLIDTGLLRWGAAAASPDGQYVAVCHLNNDGIYVYDTTSGAAVSTLKGHRGEVRSVVYSPDGKQLVSGGADGTIRFWDSATGKPRSTLTAHRSVVSDLAFSPDGKELLSVSFDFTLRVWNLETMRQRLELRAAGRRLTEAAFSVDGSMIASAGNGPVVVIWDAKTGLEVARYIAQTGRIGKVAFLPGGRLLAIGDDEIANIWDTSETSEYRQLRGHTGSALRAVYSPDGKRIFSGGSDGTVRAWDFATGKMLWTGEGHRGSVVSLVYGADTVISGGVDGTIKIWDAATGQLRSTHTIQAGAVTALAFNRKTNVLAVGRTDGTVSLRADTGMERGAFRAHAGSVLVIAWSPDGRLATVGRSTAVPNDGSEVKLWDAAGRHLATLGKSKNDTTGLAFSPNGKQLAATHAGYEGGLAVWDVDTGRPLAMLRDAEAGDSDVCFSPNGSRLFIANWEGGVRICDGATFQETARFRVSARYSQMSLALSPDGRTLAVTGPEAEVRLLETWTGPISRQTLVGLPVSSSMRSDGVQLAVGSPEGFVKIWDLATQRPGQILTNELAGNRAVAFGADGRRLASSDSNGQLRVVDLTTGRLLFTVADPRYHITRLSYSADGRLLASSGPAGFITLWNGETGEEIRSWPMDDRLIEAFDFRRDGRFLVTVGEKSGLKVWDVATGTLRFDLNTKGFRVNAAAFSPDNRLLAGGDDNGVITIWDAETGKELRSMTHNNMVTALAFGSVPTRPTVLASGDFNGVVRLWDADTGQPMQSLPGHQGTPVRLAFDARGRLSVLSEFGILRLWRFAPGPLLSADSVGR